MEIKNLIGKLFGVVASKTAAEAIATGTPTDLHLCDDTGDIVFNNRRFGGNVQSVEVNAEGDNAQAPVLVVEYCRRRVTNTLPMATTNNAGLMSAADKRKLDNLASMEPITEQNITEQFE